MAAFWLYRKLHHQTHAYTSHRDAFGSGKQGRTDSFWVNLGKKVVEFRRNQENAKKKCIIHAITHVGNLQEVCVE